MTGFIEAMSKKAAMLAVFFVAEAPNELNRIISDGEKFGWQEGF
ncbi:hypothetical protein [Paenibacillus chitinolyticus]